MGDIGAGLFVTAVLMAALHKGRCHHYLVLSGFLLDELVMKPLMYQRLSLGVFGSFPYSGTSAIPHLALAVITTVLGVLAIYLLSSVGAKRTTRCSFRPKGRYTSTLALHICWLGSPRSS
jgi:hypothetical protein